MLPKTGSAPDASAAGPIESRGGSPPPGPQPPAPAASAPEPPSNNEKADDLEAIKKAVDDAASVGGGLWLSYLFVLFYLAVAAGAVTHEDLFFERAVKLPFLGIDLPLLAFFFLAPILFIIVHAYTLVHLVFLTEKAKRFDKALHSRRHHVSAAARESLQWQLPSNIFIQFLAGPTSIREDGFGWLLRAIAWMTLVIAPVLLLLMMQVQFLPFHSSFITWTQRLALAIDLALIWWLWRRILSGREIHRHRRAFNSWPIFGVTLSACVVLFSWAIATFPGETQDDHWPDWRLFPQTDALGRQTQVSLHNWVFNSQVDGASRRRWFPFSSTLVLTGMNIYEGLGIDDPEKAKWRDFVFRARGRDLKGAIFDLAILPKVDFAKSDLEGASFNGAQLQGASLDDAHLEDALLIHTQLQGASLDNADLRSAVFPFARLQGASLNRAQLQGAHGDQAQLQGASLADAQLQGAQLTDEELEGASLGHAQIQGAALDNSQLQGASLAGAQLQGTSLQKARLEATDLSSSLLWRTNGAGERFQLVDLPKVTALTFPDAPETWSPSWRDEMEKIQPWDEKAYLDLRMMMDSLPPPGMTEMMESSTVKGWSRRDTALRRIRSLDCADPDPTLASCNPSAAPPPAAVAWRNALEAASVSDDAYRDALAKVLKSLACSGNQDAIHIVRGISLSFPVPYSYLSRLEAAGAAAIGLIGDLMDKGSTDCPVAAALTDADRAKLLQIKRAIEAMPIPATGRAYSP